MSADEWNRKRGGSEGQSKTVKSRRVSRWLVVFTRAGTYQLTAARAGPWPVSFQHSQATRERAVEHSRVTHASEGWSTREHLTEMRE